MATRKPLVRVGGKIVQLPAGDTIPGGSPSGDFTEASTAPTATAYGQRWLDTTTGIKYTWITPGVWVDLATAGIDFDDLVQTTGAQSIAGVKTFTDSPVVPDGAAGTQVPQAQEVGNLTVAQRVDIYRRSNILGAVSQSEGIPTGAVIEHGSNSNGAYIRWADGTQICTTSVASGVISTGVGSVFMSGAVSRTWPAAFAAAPEVAIGARNSVAVNCWAGDCVVSTTGISALRAFSGASGGSTVLSVTAIGRWI